MSTPAMFNALERSGDDRPLNGHPLARLPLIGVRLGIMAKCPK